jgi:NTE family protein
MEARPDPGRFATRPRADPVGYHADRGGKAMPSADNPVPPALTSPVELIDTGSRHAAPEPGNALCLSGGGYRAMLFHLGALWRLNHAGMLGKLDRISSVSGGSITAGVLGLKWSRLVFGPGGVATNFDPEVVAPVRRLAGRTLDAMAIIEGLLLPGSIGDKVADAYRKHLFEKATLQDLPDRPRFIFNATNVQSGALWRFSKPYMADYRVGRVDHPRVELAVAVAASSAFPPLLSPVTLEVDPAAYGPPDPVADLHREPFTTDLVLTDGGVYDNLGLETAWKRYQTILVSDAGGKIEPEAEPRHDWARHGIRVIGLIDNQVRSLRKRQVIDSFVAGQRQGAYWGIRTDIRNYGLGDTLNCPFKATLALANVATRLQRLEADLQERLINWGYAVCDAALRRHVDGSLPAPGGFVYPGAAV